jgi:PilZ domain-containing protein
MADRRQVPRYFFDGIAHLTHGPDSLTSEIKLHTLSVQGCRGKGSDVPPVGQKCELRIQWEGKEFQAEIEVMWKNNKGEVGLRFLTMDDSHLRMLRNICSGLQIQPLTVLPKELDKTR